MDITEIITLHKEKELTVANITLTKSYKCDSTLMHSFSSRDSNSTASLKTTLLQLQAFQFTDNNGSFGSGESIMLLLT